MESNDMQPTMNKETTITFRVEPSLRSDFTKAAKKVKMPAAQILRILMQNFIDNVQDASNLPNKEGEHRAQAIKFAEASANFEGCYFPENARPFITRYINGEMDINSILKILLA